MKKSEIILVVLALLAGLVIHLVKSEKIDRISQIFTNKGELLDQTHLNEFIEDEKILTDIKKLEIKNPAGSITVDPAPDHTAALQVTYKIYHKHKEEAQRLRSQLTLVEQENGDTTSLEIHSSKKFPLRRARAHITVKLPPGVELSILNRFGDIHALQIKSNLYIRNYYGNIKVDSCQGILEISSHRGKDVEVNNVANVRIDCLHSTLTLSNISKRVEIFKSFNSNIKIKKSSNINIEATHTNINMQEISKAVNISSTHANIIVEKCSGDLKIMAKDCHVKLKEITSETATIKNTYKNTDIKGIAAKNLYLYISHGNVDLDIAEITETLNAKGIHANITMRYPGNLLPAFNIKSLYGQIINKTSREMEILREDQTYSLITTEGNPDIILTTTYGDIVLKNSQ